MNLPESSSLRSPQVCLVGAGVVGQAILKAHVIAGISVRLADQDASAVQRVTAALDLPPDQWRLVRSDGSVASLPSIDLVYLPCQDRMSDGGQAILIESIPEKLDLKQAIFAELQSQFGPNLVLCSNTSTLRIAAIAASLPHPKQLCGMHFFMPVQGRDAVELIVTPTTSQSVVRAASGHIAALQKIPLVVLDSPGFIVNRLLSPYLNEALGLLCRGVPAETIESAALTFGMPLSPLELIDEIGTRTMFDAGRVYWQSFPTRIEPSPMLAGLVKSNRAGKSSGAGLFDYDKNGVRSKHLSAKAQELALRYHVDEEAIIEADVLHRLAIPMWIEAAIAFAEGTVTDVAKFDLAMRGGLGYDATRSWLGFYEQLGSTTLLQAIDRSKQKSKAMNASDTIRNRLAQMTPSEAIRFRD